MEHSSLSTDGPIRTDTLHVLSVPPLPLGYVGKTDAYGLGPGDKECGDGLLYPLSYRCAEALRARLELATCSPHFIRQCSIQGSLLDREPASQASTSRSSERPPSPIGGRCGVGDRTRSLPLRKRASILWAYGAERTAGIAPASSVWKTAILLLDDVRKVPHPGVEPGR